eukprot:jgi/Chrzof1/9803/Cz04g16070.t1
MAPCLFDASVVHNPLTHNFQKLVLHVLELLSAAQAGRVSQSVANAVHLVACMLKYITETAPPSSLISIFESVPSLPQSVQGQPSLLPLFINRLTQFLCNQDVSHDMSYLVVMEVLLLLVICCSSQLYTQQTYAPPDTHPILEAIMDQQSSAVPLVTVLLQLVVSRPPLPPKVHLYKPQDTSGYTVMRLVRSAAATVFWIPLRTYQYIWRSSSHPDGPSSPVSDLSLLLLLLLDHYPAHHAERNNGVRDALRNLQDSAASTDAEGGTASSAAASRTAAVSFARLYEYFAQGPHSEASTLLLYVLLHGSKSFLEYVLVRSDVETLLLPILQQLYGASKRCANHLYMLQIIILILSQDTSFSHNIHKITIASVPWYRERLLHRISLGSLVYIVLLRSALHNFGALNDLYLPTNTLAALANLAPQVNGLHSHAAQRLVGLASSLGKRYLKLARQAEEAAALGQQTAPDELQVLADFLRIVLEVINCILYAGVQRNPEVVYAVLHKQEVFAALRHHPRLTELVDNIQVVTDYFNSRLDAVKPQPSSAADAQPGWSVERLLELVQGFAQGWRADRLRPFPELRFVYEEEAQPEEFFVPYVWTLVVTTTSGHLVPWNFAAISLLTPLVGMDSGTLDGAVLEHQHTARWSDDV